MRISALIILLIKQQSLETIHEGFLHFEIIIICYSTLVADQIQSNHKTYLDQLSTIYLNRIHIVASRPTKNWINYIKKKG